MLVLTRKANEEILIGDNIKITLVRIKGGSVRVGIEAPRDVRIVRGELKKREDVMPPAHVDADVEIDPMAEVFAHPESQNLIRRKVKPVNRMAGMKIDSDTDAVMAATKDRVYVGTVLRNGENAQLLPAPLSGFVAAS